MLELMRIKKLQDTVKKNGFVYEIVERGERKAIYKHSRGYEIFKIRLSKPHHKSFDDIKNYDKVELFPGNEDFGKTAWYTPEWEKAQEIYGNI